jgi:hypothetical protein
MPVTNREELKLYCLRRLGHPVIQINVAEEQVEDRIDEAIGYYKQYHYDGTEREVLRVVVDEQMARAKAIRLPSDVVSVLNAVPTLSEFEAAFLGTPFPRDSGGSISLNHYYGSMGSNGQDLKGYAAYSIQLDVMQWLFRPERSLTFRRANNSITFDLSTPMAVGDVFILEVYRAVDVESSQTLWDDLWLKEFATCLIKLQWGSNLMKYNGVNLPTGIQLNGQGIYDEASAEREKLIERLRAEFEMPLDFFLG